MIEYVVVTGASSGIGQALAILFANAGHHVVAIGRNEVSLQQIKAMVANPHKVTTLVCDLGNKGAIDHITTFFKAEDKISYLIHCAATTEPHLPLAMIGQTALENSMNVNVMTPIFLTQKLIPQFTAMKTRVLFMGSDYVGVDNKFRPNITVAYGMSKSALRVAVEYFRREDTPFLVGYLNPGTTNTPMLATMKATLNKQGVFNNTGEAANPRSVAEFIVTILENTSDTEYKKTDWDFRKHNESVIKEGAVIPLKHSKL